jgi:hypothetical protein
VDTSPAIHLPVALVHIDWSVAALSFDAYMPAQ